MIVQRWLCGNIEEDLKTVGFNIYYVVSMWTGKIRRALRMSSYDMSTAEQKSQE